MFRTHSNSCFRIMDLGSRFTAHFKDLNTKKELSFFGWSGQVGLVGFSKLLVFSELHPGLILSPFVGLVYVGCGLSKAHSTISFPN